MITLRSAEEGRVILSKIEQSVGGEVLADWLIEGCNEYKSGNINSLKFSCIYNYLIGFAEDKFNNRRHEVLTHPTVTIQWRKND